MPLPAGKKLGPYDVVALIGAGGMGEVYRARDPRLGRDVAIKILPAEVAGHPERLARFQREARAVAAVNHPHIVTIYSVEEADGIHFLTMELVEGRPLDQLILAGGLPADQLVEVAGEMAGALAAAHEKGIVHRDFKPGNVMVTNEGRVKVLDFGLARDLRGASNEDITALSLDTLPGTVMGTIAYMSPEQLSGAPVDHRSDIFSLGIVLHQMASGRHPFAGPSSATRISAILRDTPGPISEIRPDLPSDVTRIVRRCLEKDPQRRIQTARDVANEFREMARQASPQRANPAETEHTAAAVVALTDSGSSQRAITAKTNQKTAGTLRKRGVLAAVVFVAALVAGIWYLRRPAAMPFQNFTITQLTNTGNYIETAISPDGKYLLSSVGENGKQSLWLRNIPTGSDTQVIAPADASYRSLAFSSDGNYIYFLRAGSAAGDEFDLLRAPVLGGTPQVVVRDDESGAAFSPDGTRMAFTRTNHPADGKFSLITSNLDGTDEKVIATGPKFFYKNLVDWSPDGTEIALAITGPGQGNSLIQILSLASSKSRILARFDDLPLDTIVWLPDRRGLLALYDTRIGYVDRDQIGFISARSGEFRTITNDTNDYSALTLSNDGKTLATVQQKRTETLYLMPASGFIGGTPDPAPAQSKGAAMFGWTSDGDLYFGDGGDLLRMGVDGSNRTTLLSDPGSQVIHPISCPGGRYVILTWSNHAGSKKTDIWRVDADGSNPKQLAFESTDVGGYCSTDGKWVYYASIDTSQGRRVPIDGGPSEEVPGSHGLFNLPGFGLSPDGKLVAFLQLLKNPNGASGRIVLLPAQGGPTPQANFIAPDSRIAGEVQFTPDSKALVYIIGENGSQNLWLQPLDSSPGHQLTQFQGDVIQFFLYSPDGKTLGVMRTHREADVVLLRDTGSRTNTALRNLRSN